MYHTLIPVLVVVSLLTATRTTLAQQTPLQCRDPAMTRWMLNSDGQTPCQVLQDTMRICNPSYAVDWLTPSYSCDNSLMLVTAACCCGSPTFALFSACWSCQYNYTMDIVSTTFTSFEKDCSYIPNPLNEYDPIIRSQVEQVNIPLWAEMIPSAGKWDLTGAFRNATPDIPTVPPPVPTNYPMPSGNTLSAAAIIGIIVGSVLGTTLMFILAALILWGTLGPGCRRRRKTDDDIRVGRDMGYLEGEYIYVRPGTIPEIVSPNGGHRYMLRRESQHLQVNLPGVSGYSSPGPSEHDDDTFGSFRPPAIPVPLRFTHFVFNSRPRSGQFGSRPASGQFDFYHVPVDFDTPPHARPPPIRPTGSRPVSAQFSTRPRSGQFEFYPVHGDDDATAPAQAGSHPVSGQSSTRPRGSADRRRDHRMSMRSSLRHASMDLTRRSGEGAGKFVKLAEGRRISLDGGRISLERQTRFSLEEGRFNREEPRFSREDGWGRRSREARRSRDLFRKASLSEGDEDRQRQRGNEGDEEESVEAQPRPSGATTSSAGAPPRHSEATASGVGRAVHQQHLRQRSQSARTSCEVDVVVQDYDDAQPSPMPLTSSSSGAHTSSSNSGGVPTKPPRSPLRLVHPVQSDSDKDHRPNSNLRPQPSLLARARGLLSTRSSRSNISSGNLPASADGAPAPPSAWQQRLPNLLLRNRSGSTDLARGRSEDSARGSDVTSLYFSAIGHNTPMHTPGARDEVTNGERQEQVDNGGHRQEVDAGVQLIAESSLVSSEDSDGPAPPTYPSSSPGIKVVDSPLLPDSQVSETLPPPGPDVHLHVEFNRNRLSTITQDTATSVDWNSTISSGVIQTWEAARRPTGFVGMGRVLSPSEPNTQQSQVSLSTAMSNYSDTEDGAGLLSGLQTNRVE
ncbi:hypothetical protein OPQ81_002249 [Rhizoctonia solani]|nr:hypothetical protein OPQ81_002249 [Rhizoctonia solani]